MEELAALTTLTGEDGLLNGKVWRDRGRWHLELLPDVRAKARRIWPSMHAYRTVLSIQATAHLADELEWFLLRYPCHISEEDLAALTEAASTYRASRKRAVSVAAGKWPPCSQARPLAYPLRPYQEQAVAFLEAVGAFILADAVGLGKTVSAIGAVNRDDGGIPAVVVVPKHLMTQWKEEFLRFAPHLSVHTLRAGNYTLPPHDVLILPYSRLRTMKDRLAAYSTAIFDEAQELRHSGSDRYNAAAMICQRARFRVALTATPVYNYGIEVYNILDCLESGCLGDLQDFYREWCNGGKGKVTDPDALGSFLRRQNRILRRTREDVHRQLPPVLKSVETVDHDAKVLEVFQHEALQLARTVLESSLPFFERGQAARQLDLKMREATGIAKAAQVAERVSQIVEGGEKVILYGYHHKVYAVWEQCFAMYGIPVARYTGLENTARKKEDAKRAFVEGDAKVLIISLRAGVGVDGLQKAAHTVVFGELDWSPAVMWQDIGRADRDGQDNQVVAIYMVSECGSDPPMVDLLGLKQHQGEHIVDPDEEGIVSDQVMVSRGVELAMSVVKAATH